MHSQSKTKATQAATTTSPRNYVEIVAKGSFWNGLNFIVLGATGFATSILLTRYLGADLFGTYSYIFGLITAASLLLDFGFGQACHRYFPRYIHDRENRGLALMLFKRMTLIQVIVCALVSLILWQGLPIWKQLVSVTSPNEVPLLLLSIAIITPSVLFKQLTNFFSASHNFRDIALTNGFIQVLTLVLCGAAVYFHLDLIAFIWLLLVNRLAGSLILFIIFQRKFASISHQAQKTIEAREFNHYTSLAYINSVLQFVVWAYSEIFFLGKYSTAREVGYYSLAFSLAGIITSFMGVLQRSVYNTQFELLEQNKEAESDTMGYLVAKYSSLIFLPVFIGSTIIIGTVINLFYGTEYAKVQIVFPFVLLGAIFGFITTPINTKTSNSNKQFGTTIVISLIGALINITLDIFLIPRYASIGAGIASFTSQTLVVIAVTSYVFVVRRFAPGITWIRIIKIFLLNAVIAGCLFTTTFHLSLPMVLKVMLIILAVPIYYLGLRIFNIFEKADKEVVQTTLKFTPSIFRPIIQFVAKLVTV